jgi:quercetin dioxygenase-like cupin family protein
VSVGEDRSVYSPAVAPGSGQRCIAPIGYLGNLVRPLLGGRDTKGRLALIHSVERRGCEPPRHRHRNEDELVYVLEGELTFYVGEDPYVVATGNCLLLPKGQVHGYRVESQEATLLTTLMPAGLECFYAELGETASGLDFERLLTVAARYGIEITGPSPAG